MTAASESTTPGGGIVAAIREAARILTEAVDRHQESVGSSMTVGQLCAKHIGKQVEVAGMSNVLTEVRHSGRPPYVEVHLGPMIREWTHDTPCKVIDA